MLCPLIRGRSHSPKLESILGIPYNQFAPYLISQHLCVSLAYLFSDLEERASQVQLMGHIYQGASLVVVWLGTSWHSGSDGIPHLEYLANSNIELPPLHSIFDGNKVVLPHGLDIDAKAVYEAYASAASIVMSQWFRRTWVIQELCWAKKVVFAMNEVEISVKAIVKTFDIAQDYATHVDNMASSDDYDDLDPRVGAKYIPVWAPHIQHGI